MAYDEQDGLDEAVAPKRRGWLPLAAAAVVVFGVGIGAGVAGASMLGTDDDTVAGEAGDSRPTRAARSVVNLGMFNVNIRGSGGARVLRMEVQLEVESDDIGAFEEMNPILRDGVIALASDYTYADLEGLDGKTHLRDELLGRLNTLVDHVRIERVFFTEFVVQ